MYSVLPQPMLQPPKTKTMLPTALAECPYRAIGHGSCAAQPEYPGSHLRHERSCAVIWLHFSLCRGF